MFSLTKEISNTVRDFGVVALYVYYLRVYLHNNIEDVLLFFILMCHQIVFGLNFFTVSYLVTLILLIIFKIIEIEVSPQFFYNYSKLDLKSWKF